MGGCDRDLVAKRRTKRPRTIEERLPRDLILFFVGLAGIIHETVVEAGERPYLITAFLGMCGLPVWLNRDEVRQLRNYDDEPNGEEE